jgi:Na+-transporting NADH:ubiquinone oxidoreductase subunit B
MKFLRTLLDKQKPLFEKGGKLEKLYPLYEANDTFLFTPGTVTKGAAHVRDALDLKRMMITVVVALIPCIFMAMYNTGYQANAAMAPGAADATWRAAIIGALGVGYSPASVLACLIHGALYFLPVLVVCFAVGGGIEVLFAIVRKHEVNEGFLVTGFLIPLVLPPAIPLWQVAVGTAFGVIAGKELFGGTGMNILNPTLVTRAFLFFAYPGQISGDKVWTAVSTANQVDGFSGATALGRMAAADASVANAAVDTLHQMGVTWWHAFLGLIPGSMGETSTLACLIGALILILTKVGSWRTMLGLVLGSLGIITLLNAVGSNTNAMFGLPFYWHMVLGGWAFGLVFMATEPVTSPFTDMGRFVYGLMIGVLAILIRVVNPAYPEGMMLAILLMNVFAPLIDHIAMSANIKRRMARSAV